VKDDLAMTVIDAGRGKGVKLKGGRRNDQRFGARIGSRETRQSVTGCGCLVRSERFRSPSPPFFVFKNELAGLR